MATLVFKGHSDDVLMVKGDLTDEFYPRREGETDHFALSDGTLLGVRYDGLWRIDVIVQGTSTIIKVVGSEIEDTDDVVTVEGDVRWVLYGRNLKKVKQACK